MILKLYTVLLFSTTLCVFSQAQSTSNDLDTFSVEELQEDFNFWRDRLVETNPILYLYNSKADFNRHFDSLYQKIDRPMTQLEFFQLIAPTTGFLKEGHSQVHEDKKSHEYIVKSEDLVPLNIEWFGDTAFVSYNYTSEKELAIGTEIVRINSVPIEEIYSKCLAIMPRDAYSIAYPKYWVNRNFWFYYHLTQDLQTTYTIEFKNSNNELDLLTVSGLSIKEMNAIEAADDLKRDEFEENLTLRYVDSTRTAILKISTFSGSTVHDLQKTSFKKLINAQFDEIIESGYERLIIDVRGNDGGNPKNVTRTMKRILQEEFEFKSEIRKIKHSEEEELYKRTRKVYLNDGGLGTFKPKSSTFKGKIIVLVDGGATSAAGEFVSIFRRYNRGLILGTESGGSPEVLSGWWIGFIKHLPNTKLRTVCGQKCSIMQSLELDTGYGLIPDQIVERTIRDHINNYDKCLMDAMQLIQK